MRERANGAGSGDFDVVVVGGGIAGLTAAATAARERGPGARVAVLESVSELGGRARTREEGGFLFNMGPHALYVQSTGAEVLRELGISVSGGIPPSNGAMALREGRLHALPTGFVSILSTGLISLAEKLELARFLAGIERIDPAPFDAVPVGDALARLLRHEGSRAVARALVRVTSYANAPDVHSGGAALRQIQRALAGGVRYLDGGWRTLVSGLEKAACEAGVAIRTAARATAVELAGAGPGAGWRVRLASGESLVAPAVVVALGPAEAAALVDGGANALLARHAREAVPARAACLDVALRTLPRPKARFLLGIDEPFYFSVHTGPAKLGPEGGAVIHVARYLAPGESPERAGLERELEGLLDRMQPGWRDAVAARKLMRELPVANAVPLASQGGEGGRPGPALAGRPGLFLAGDWVGARSQLADASFASGREAGRLAARAVEASRRGVASAGAAPSAYEAIAAGVGMA
ncbi:MAG TPA: FAD-dependent oxidoreductase [Myxococcota bacterium]|jgi:phytoene dehydrogenase-like protein|nr:FAD-dependent oxidoreductase [Myxococcota bacterium]